MTCCSTEHRDKFGYSVSLFQAEVQPVFVGADVSPAVTTDSAYSPDASLSRVQWMSFVASCSICLWYIKMIQEEKSIPCEGIVSVIVTKKFIWTWVILLSRHHSVRFCLWVWMQSEVYNIKLDTNCSYRILPAAACMKKLRWTTHELRLRVTTCTDLQGVIFLWAVRNFPYLCNKCVI